MSTKEPENEMVAILDSVIDKQAELTYGLDLRDLAIQYIYQKEKIEKLLALLGAEHEKTEYQIYACEPLNRVFRGEDGELESEMVSVMDLFIAGPDLRSLVEIRTHRESVTEILKTMKFYEECLSTTHPRELFKPVLVTCFPLTQGEIRLLQAEGITLVYVSDRQLVWFRNEQKRIEEVSF